MIITRMSLPRRTFLRGLGAAVALPFLDSMAPALTPLRLTAAAPVRRLGIVYVPNGVYMQHWTPVEDGRGFELPSTMQPLAAHRDRMLVLSGLSNKMGDAWPGEGAGDHARAAGAYLTGVHPRKTEGADLRAGLSMDQIAAKALGAETQLSSLELSLESRENVGSCDPGYACAYANTLCWSSPTTPLPMENNPRVVFERLFGGNESTDPEAWRARREEDRSILDAVGDKISRLQGDLGRRDRRKLEEYLEAIRDAERRIQMAEAQSARELPVIDQPAGIPSTFEEHARLMYDLQVLAFQADLTRVITFMVGHETSQRAYPEIGVPDAHHPLSHHGGNTEKIEKAHQGESLSRRDVRLLSRPAAGDSGRRRLVAGPDDDPLRRRDERRQRSPAPRSADHDRRSGQWHDPGRAPSPIRARAGDAGDESVPDHARQAGSAA